MMLCNNGVTWNGLVGLLEILNRRLVLMLLGVNRAQAKICKKNNSVVIGALLKRSLKFPFSCARTECGARRIVQKYKR
jgi:hypothetical protein